MSMKKVELLAPAGNLQAFYGAIHAGADAIYLGGDKFGARAYADNFTTEELVACIRYAHILGRKVYLTVNTLVKDKEWDQLFDYIKPFYEAGLDGVIIQDLGVFLYLKESFPDMELHVSTQMTLTGSHGASFMKSLGACRIVPARELSLDEIKTIKQETGLEIEAFIHGAMCYCYSGQCLFSSILGGRSGNRGRCAQPCRLPYQVSGASLKGQYYPLSLKDMCTAEYLPELIEAGIDSFKIEGRMKKPEYAAGVTAVYRKLIDRYYQNPSRYKVTDQELQMLASLYIRSERQEGYYYKHNGADMITLHNPAYNGSDEGLLTDIRENYLEQQPQLPVCITGSFRVDQPAQITISLMKGHEKCSTTVTGEPVMTAQNRPITQENVRKQLAKLGDTLFICKEMNICLDDNAFYPLKAINDLRRAAICELENLIISSHGLPCHRTCKNNDHISQYNESSNQLTSDVTVGIQTYDQLEAILSYYLNNKERTNHILPGKLYINADLLTGRKGKECLELLSHFKASFSSATSRQISVYPVLPYIIRKSDGTYLRHLAQIWDEYPRLFQGCRVRSLEGYAWLRSIGFSGEIGAEAGFYIWNHTTLQFWQGKLNSFTLPYELNAGEQKELLKGISVQADAAIRPEKLIYGYLPMMVTANCVLKTTNQCRKKEQAVLTDRYQKKFPVAACCEHCMNIIYNSVPVSLHGAFSQWKNKTDLRIDFTIEKAEETTAILNAFCQMLTGNHIALPFKEYTTGHEKRGVE